MPNKASLSLNEADFKNLGYIVRELKKFDVDASKVMYNEAKNTVEKIKRDAPVDTGRLRSNVEAQLTTLGSVEITSEAYDPETGEDYAVIQEFGSRFLPAQPYFFKWVHRYRSKVTNSLRQIFINLSSLKRAR